MFKIIIHVHTYITALLLGAGLADLLRSLPTPTILCVILVLEALKIKCFEVHRFNSFPLASEATSVFLSKDWDRGGGKGFKH